MDTVILAAGKGERLNGIMPRFWKPLLVVDGTPLIRQAVVNAHAVAKGNVIIVAAPENVSPICDVIDDLDATVVVQRRASGPGDGLRLGLQLSRTNKTLVLMGDNINSMNDVERVTTAQPFGIGIRRFDPTPDVERFTRFHVDRWIEKQPLTEREKTEKVTAWLGPVTVETGKSMEVYDTIFSSRDYEIGIGPYLNRLAPQAELIEVTSFDIGTPETVNGEQK